MIEPLQAVILTGARDSHNPLLEGTGVNIKVMLPVGGKPMVLRVMENIMASRYQPQLSLSTNHIQPGDLQTEIPYGVLPSGESAVQSLLKGVEHAPGEGWVLLVSGDHPLLTTEMIDYFIEEAMRRELTFAVAVVAKATVDAAHPESRRTYFHAKGGSYSGGNLYLINKKKFMGNTSVLETIDRNRKKPWKSVTVLDPVSLIQVLFRQLPMQEVAERAGRAIGCKTGVIDMPFAEACMDVDKPSDKEIAERILRERGEVFDTPPSGQGPQHATVS